MSAGCRSATIVPRRGRITTRLSQASRRSAWRTGRQPDADRVGQRLLVEQRGRGELERHDALAHEAVRLRVLGVGIGGGVRREHGGRYVHD